MKEVDANTDLHNFTLDGDHTYIANGYVAHNKRGGRDPLAQTFMITDETGVFVTKIDIFFQAKDDQMPVKFQINTITEGEPDTSGSDEDEVENYYEPMEHIGNGEFTDNLILLM